MTNTYPPDAPLLVKLLEEVRCLRCVNERILRAMDEGLFVDYQMEKFSTFSACSDDEETKRNRAMMEKHGELLTDEEIEFLLPTM